MESDVPLWLGIVNLLTHGTDEASNNMQKSLDLKKRMLLFYEEY